MREDIKQPGDVRADIPRYIRDYIIRLFKATVAFEDGLAIGSGNVFLRTALDDVVGDRSRTVERAE